MGKKQTFIVDDQMGIRLLLKEIISSEGHQVKEFESGQALFQECEKNKPDFVFVDYSLPAMNGREIADRLSQKYGNQVAVYIMSGYSMDEIDMDMKNPNIKGFLQKPFDVTEVIGLLKENTPS
ncbi:response regulator [Salinibacillus xinjiangensis]|uniref:Response regulator n=1 Tax=Salinibacillus xinjiangensis TaxID=1229268 RepID=A0A6G1X5P2_9BACI|nr:response regulator [Salinibacillus xinjiangensis]MRG86225.1 response regulator [Salinibacillus xinjiangensis]